MTLYQETELLLELVCLNRIESLPNWAWVKAQSLENSVTGCAKL
jgi:hypothetical protein